MNRFKKALAALVAAMLLGVAAPAMAQRGCEGSGAGALENLIAQYVDSHAKGVTLSGKLAIRYVPTNNDTEAVFDDQGTLVADSTPCTITDTPMLISFKATLWNGLNSGTFFGHGESKVCFSTGLDAQAAAVQAFISGDVIPRLFYGTPAWAFKSITNFRELPGGYVQGYPLLIEETSLVDFSIAVKGVQRLF
jgi:hypothetical protein